MYQEKTIIVEKIPVSYRTHGFDKTKEVVLLLHGWGSNKESFEKIQSKISNSVALDMPGFGKTPLDERSWDITEYTKFVSEFCRELGMGSIALVVGHSFGGRIAIEASSKNIIDFKKICLSGTPIRRGQKTTHPGLQIIAQIAKFVPGNKKLRNIYYKRVLGVSDYVATEGTPMKDVFLRVIADEAAGKLSQVTVPVLLLWGAQDTIINHAEADYAVNLLTNGSVELVSGADHYPFIDNPDEFMSKLNAWRS